MRLLFLYPADVGSSIILCIKKPARKSNRSLTIFKSLDLGNFNAVTPFTYLHFNDVLAINK